jgi:gliding motility-associated-like protein
MVNIFALPNAAFSAPPVCEELPAAFVDGSTVASGTVSSWAWSFGDNSTSAAANPYHTYPNPGNYPIHLVIATDHGCPDSTDGVIRIIPKPLVDFLTENVCFGFPAQLTQQSAAVTGSVVQYNWSFGDGTSSTDENPIHYYPQAGWFPVNLTVTTDSGCTASLLRQNAINIFPKPNATFYSDASQADDVFPRVSFINLTTTQGYYYWAFGDGDTSTVYSPSHLYDTVGVYDVQLVAVDYNGCVDTTLMRVEIRPTSAVFIPNSFTPNGDRSNDLFKVYSYNVVSLKAQIYDRWGLEVYTWDGLDGGWDGRVQGNNAQSDVYVYRVETVDVNSKKDVRIGHVSLLR